VARVLLEAGFSPDADSGSGETALHLSCYSSSLSSSSATPAGLGLVELLIDAGAAVDARNKYQETALFYACRHHRGTAVARLLIQVRC
jgi:ankyrin repeat protein